MTSIIYIGMDVHTTNYTLCSYIYGEDDVFAQVQVGPDYRNILKYLQQVREIYSECYIKCGYEAGSLGYSLYHQLANNGVDCIILAPTSMPETRRKGIKNDKRDARKIAKCLANNTYSPVYIPSNEDDAVKEYIRMRDDQKDTVKKLKQRILSFCTRHGKFYCDGGNWTQKHLVWLKKLDFGNAVLQETLQEYLILYHQASEKVVVYDKRIEELAKQEAYAEKVKKLSCFIGVKTHTALALIVETGDFNRFAKAQNYSSYLGLVPGEDSSGSSIQRTGITKAGNSHLRRLLVEAAHSYSRGSPGQKSKTIAARQAGNEPKVIAYADRSNERLRRKFHRLMYRKTKYNVAITAIAREMACFIWGMMTDNIA